MTGEKLYSFAELYRHYRACRRNKRNTWNALAFEIDAETNLLALQAELRDHTYRPGRSICFVTDGPKPREVFAADFRDRIVHHLLVWHQERVFEPLFIHDSYACRHGKGTLAASDRLTALLRRATANGRRPAWALKLDIASFFASIHKESSHASSLHEWHAPSPVGPYASSCGHLNHRASADRRRPERPMQRCWARPWLRTAGICATAPPGVIGTGPAWRSAGSRSSSPLKDGACAHAGPYLR